MSGLLGEPSFPDVPLLRKVREHIGAHPEEWDQTAWRTTPEVRALLARSTCDCSDCQQLRARQAETCGTAYCFAGWAVTIAGMDWADECRLIDDTGTSVDVAPAARELLGLLPYEANALFDSTNDLPRIDMILTGIYARAERS